MAQVSRFLRRTGVDTGHTAGGYAHWCPACKGMHAFAVDGPQSNGARWSFNGNLELPTFSPSMNITWGPFPDGRTERCHYFIRAGQIDFCADSTHELAGQTVPLPELPKGLQDFL